jgi:hypothetical protein
LFRRGALPDPRRRALHRETLDRRGRRHHPRRSCATQPDGERPLERARVLSRASTPTLTDGMTAAHFDDVVARARGDPEHGPWGSRRS